MRHEVITVPAMQPTAVLHFMTEATLVTELLVSIFDHAKDDPYGIIYIGHLLLGIVGMKASSLLTIRSTAAYPSSWVMYLD